MLDIEEIKKNLSIVGVAQADGLRVTGEDKHSFILCPWHDDKNPSCELYPEQNKGYCHACKKSFDVIDLWAFTHNCTNEEALKRLSDEFKPKREFVCSYDYLDESGRLLYQVCRSREGDKKTFVQRRPDGNRWIYNLKGVDPIPYRLQELIKAIQSNETVYNVEGEKDVESLVGLGLAATCNSGGAGKWSVLHSKFFPAGADVVILPDNDLPGKDHAQAVAKQLHERGCRVRVVDLPGLPAKGDVSDWLAAGHTKAELLQVVAGAEYWEPIPIEDKIDPSVEPAADDKKPSQADILIGILEGCELFHDELKETHAKIQVHDHFEVWPVRSTIFKRWLVGKFYSLTGRGCNSDAVNQALNVADAKALFDGKQITLSLRCAEREGALWYDLADDQWQAIKVTPNGWEVVPAPIMFRRFANTDKQVMPSRRGDIHLLRKFVNLKNDDDFNLLAVYIISCFVPNVPKIVLPVSGEKGASKSTTLRVLRRLVDPARKELLTLPNDQKELPLILYKNYMPTFDNLSVLNGWQSDMLCCAATGGGISKRRLYTDDEEVILSFLRCVTLNGINTVATRPDLLDRSITFEMDRIDETDRKTERQFWNSFEQVRADILGGIFDTLSSAMGIYPTVKLGVLPRMADFCLWGYAVAEALGWTGEDFLAAYYRNIHQANDEALRNSPVAAAVVNFMKDRKYWHGSAAELLNGLNDDAWRERIDTNSKTWPKSAMSLSRRLKQYKSNFSDAGIVYRAECDPHTKTNHITFQKGTETIPATTATTANSVMARVQGCGGSAGLAGLANSNTRKENSVTARAGGSCGGCGDKIPTLLETADVVNKFNGTICQQREA